MPIHLATPFRCPVCEPKGRLGPVEEELRLVVDPDSLGDQDLGLSRGERITSVAKCTECGLQYEPTRSDPRVPAHEAKRREAIRNRMSHVAQVPDGLAMF